MNYQPNDVNSVKLLICYLLYHLEMQITPEGLYDIAVDSGTINYFHYNEALDEILINDTILSKIDENGKVVLSLSEKGITYVKDFSTYVQRSFRDRLMHSAIQYKAQQLKNASLYTDYEELENKLDEFKNRGRLYKLFQERIFNAYNKTCNAKIINNRFGNKGLA